MAAFFNLTGLLMGCSFFFQAEDGIRDLTVTGVQTCALPICDDRAVAAVREHDAIEVVDVLDAAHRSESDLRRAGNEASPGDFDVLPDDSRTQDRKSVV